jgi:hypothetical protein
LVAQLDRDYLKSRPSKVISRLVSYALFEGRPLTTMGQWINPLVFIHFGLEKSLPQLRVVKQPLFVIGTGRSGTTILGVLMSMHKDVGFLNEPKALWHSVFPYEDVIGSYTRVPAKYRLDEKDVTPEVARNAHRLFGAYLWTVRSGRLVDKYPELVFRVPFVKAIFPDAKFIFLVRNGWDTCSSIKKWSKRLGVSQSGETHDWWGADNRKWNLMLDELVVPDPIFSDVIDRLRALSNHSDMAAVEWIVTMREGLRRKEQNPDSIHLIRYEDMVEKPRQSLSALLRFAELDDDQPFFEYAEKVLRPAPIHAPFDLDAAIRPIFDDTMKLLGYPTA